MSVTKEVHKIFKLIDLQVGLISIVWNKIHAGHFTLQPTVGDSVNECLACALVGDGQNMVTVGDGKINQTDCSEYHKPNIECEHFPMSNQNVAITILESPTSCTIEPLNH